MTTQQCAAITKAGKTCTWQPWKGNPWCLAHSAKNGIPEALDLLKQRGIEGGRKAEYRRESARLKTCDLRTTDGQLTQLEGALVRVGNCELDACKKASAICALISEARSVMRDSVLEKENAELRRLLVERHPQLAKQLKSVP